MKQVRINVSAESLLATITFQNNDIALFNSAKLLLTSLYDDAIFSDNAITIKWHSLKKLLPQLAYLIKQNNSNLELNDFTQRLFDDFISDKKSTKTVERIIEMDTEDINPYLENLGFNRKLTDQQKRDVSKLIGLRHGANFSVPGAGKTTAILAVHSILKSKGIVDKLLVVSPINAFISWSDELSDILGITPLRLSTNMIRDPNEIIQIQEDVIIVNYEKIRKDIDNLIPLFLKYKVHVILDESHRIKGGTNNLSFTQIISISDLAKRRDILSGTPMPQSYHDLEPQFDFLWPSEFLIPDMENVADERKKIKLLSEAIEPLFVRTTKNELELGPLIPLYKKIDIGPLQKELYKLFKSEAARKLSGMDRITSFNFRKIGKSVIRLIQAASNPILLSEKNDFLDETLPIPEGEMFWQLLDEFYKYEKSAKINYILKRLDELIAENNDTKVLIWSSFIKNIQLLEKILHKFHPVSIYGAVPSGSDEEEGTRERQIRIFHEDKNCRVMLANPQACGEGISLHKACHYAIYLDRTFNAAYYLQSIDRIHRLGLDKNIETRVEILISKGTIDEILIDRINAKIKTMGLILDDKYLEAIAYDPVDIPLDNAIGIDDADFELIKQHIFSNEKD